MSTNEPMHAEPWLRGTLTDVPAVIRAVLHALELASEDTKRFCGALTAAQLDARPFGLPPVAFHLRHMARSIDRLLTYAEGHELSDEQLAGMESESNATSREELFSEVGHALTNAELRIRAFDVTTIGDVRRVGRKRLPTTVAGLLVHIADHTQRHIGQAVTTSKIVVAQTLRQRE